MEKNHHQNIGAKQHFQEKTAAFCAAHFLRNFQWTEKTLCAEHKRKTENSNLRLKFEDCVEAAFISENSHTEYLKIINTSTVSNEMCVKDSDRRSVKRLYPYAQDKSSFVQSFLSAVQDLETDVLIQRNKENTYVSNFQKNITRL
ncbi:hypothetical protein [Candidatus Bealeia paramacronuclearis]|uniref:hypothetical protein n=1 Tax=Candidatus Bealeia paramacronuclearis TaxID=1921001 RepID=UPI002F26B5DD